MCSNNYLASNIFSYCSHSYNQRFRNAETSWSFNSRKTTTKRFWKGVIIFKNCLSLSQFLYNKRPWKIIEKNSISKSNPIDTIVIVSVFNTITTLDFETPLRNWMPWNVRNNKNNILEFNSHFSFKFKHSKSKKHFPPYIQNNRVEEK